MFKKGKNVKLPYSVSPERRVDLVPSRSYSFPNMDELCVRERENGRSSVRADVQRTVVSDDIAPRELA